MEKIFKYINEKSNNKFKNLLFFAGQYNTKTNTLCLTFNNVVDFDNVKDSNKELEELIKKYFKNKVNVECKIKNFLFDESVCLKEIKNFIAQKKELENLIDTDKLFFKKQDDEYFLSIPTDKEYLSNSFINELDIILFDIFNRYNKPAPSLKFNKTDIKEIDNVLEKRVKENYRVEQLVESDFVKTEDIVEVLGKIENFSEVVCVNNNLETVKNITVCGTVLGVRQREYTKNEKTKQMVSFKLVDGKNMLDCVFFGKGGEKLLELESKDVVALGDIEEYNSNKSLKIKAVCLARIIKPEVKYKKAEDSYISTFPEKFVELKQSNFLDNSDIIKSEYLLNNTFVVYDLETTGLDIGSCQIIEIGAIKIEKGILTQQFETLINPGNHIPDDATKVNHITDEMVKDAPFIDKAIADFYKFCDGCIMVAHNGLGYDYPIVKRVGFEHHYNFNNEQQDTYVLSRKLVHGLNKYVLKNVCDHFGISLEGAHRALNDTVATAKLFVKLMENCA